MENKILPESSLPRNPLSSTGYPARAGRLIAYKFEVQGSVIGQTAFAAHTPLLVPGIHQGTNRTADGGWRRDMAPRLLGKLFKVVFIVHAIQSFMLHNRY